MQLSLNSIRPDYRSISSDSSHTAPDPELSSPSSKDSGRIQHPTDGCCPETRVDGVWSWVVAVSSFVIIMIVSGICFTPGIISEAFVIYFHLEDNVGKGAIPGAVLQAIYLGTGN